MNDSARAANRTDESLLDRIIKYTKVLKTKKKCQNSIKIFGFFRSCKSSHKIWHKIYIYSWDRYEQTFETNIQAATITAPDAGILWNDRPSIQYEQIRLDENFRQYFEGIIMSNKTLRTGMQKTPHQKIMKSIQLHHHIK